MLGFFVFSLDNNAMTSINVISTSDIDVMPTMSFDTHISVSSPRDFIGFQFKLLYDQSKFRLNNLSLSSGLNSGNFVSNVSVVGEIIVTYVNVSDVISSTQDFELFTLNFTISFSNTSLTFIPSIPSA